MPDLSASRRSPGELEASVLAVLWTADVPMNPAEVQQALGDGLARTTVATILTRLRDKGTVTRHRAGRGYAYTPTHDAAGLAARRMRTELDKEADHRTVLTHFVAGLSASDERMLRNLLLDADRGRDGSGVP